MRNDRFKNFNRRRDIPTGSAIVRVQAAAAAPATDDGFTCVDIDFSQLLIWISRLYDGAVDVAAIDSGIRVRAVSERTESVGGFPNRLISASSFTPREGGGG